MNSAGGINADVKDMATWTIFQLGNGTFEGREIISPENMAYMHTPRTPAANVMTFPKMYYCQGWFYEEMNGSPPFYWHNGETLGNHAMILFVPSENMGIVVLANEAGPSLPDALALSFYQQYFGIDTTDITALSLKQFQETNAALLAPKPVRPADAAPPLPLTRYTGSYTDDLYGKATVAEKDGNLTLTFGKNPQTLFLSPWDGNTFAASLPPVGTGLRWQGRVRDWSGWHRPPADHHALPRAGVQPERDICPDQRRIGNFFISSLFFIISPVHSVFSASSATGGTLPGLRQGTGNVSRISGSFTLSDSGFFSMHHREA